MIYKKLLKPVLFSKDAEVAHELAIKMATLTNNSNVLQELCRTLFSFEDSRLKKEFWGLSFPNPIGLAAGFDKNGCTPLAMQALGFGFVEVGSITAEASAGNPRPRAFRIPEDESLINRMGLNNEGATEIINRLRKYRLGIPLGVNIAKTNDPQIHGDAALQDYLFSYEKAQEVADYITVNISCPNTGEGKTFEDPEALRDLLQTLQPGLSGRRPTLVKFSVDTPRDTLHTLVEICEEHGVDGYVATNTSSSREGLRTSSQKLQNIGNGGLSGKAIAKQSTRVVGWLSDQLQGSKPIVGVGGVRNLESALEKLDAGADLLQIYTGMVYEGPSLPGRLNRNMVESGRF